MAMTKVHVWHDLEGTIVAVGRAVGSARCVPGPSATHFVLEIEVEESEISSMHYTHRIDPVRQAVVKIPVI